MAAGPFYPLGSVVVAGPDMVVAEVPASCRSDGLRRGTSPRDCAERRGTAMNEIVVITVTTKPKVVRTEVNN